MIDKINEKTISCTDEICTILRGLPYRFTVDGTKKEEPRFVVLLFCNRQRLYLPGRVQPSTSSAEGLNFCVRDENRWIPFAIVTGIVECSSHTHNCIVSFPFSLENYQTLHKSIDLRTSLDLLVSVSSMPYSTYTPDLSPRSLQGVSHIFIQGYLILRWVSRLDAFSVYPVQTSLPSCAAWRDNWCTIGLFIPVLSY